MAFKKTKTACIIEFHALLRSTNQTENKGVMVGSFGKTSTKDLTVEELRILITRLREMQPASADTPKPLRRARSVVIGLLDELGKTTWPLRNEYCELPQIFGKRLNETNDVDETKALARKLRVIIRKRAAKVEEENYLAANN